MGVRIYENIVKIHTNVFTIRVWFARELEGPSAAEQQLQLRNLLQGGVGPGVTDPVRLAKFIADELLGVNAVEVLHNISGTGSLAYNDWP